MANEQPGCYGDLGTSLANSFNITDFRENVNLLSYIKTRALEYVENWTTMSVDFPDFKKDCGPQNHLHPTATHTDKRIGSICCHDLDIKLNDDCFINSPLGLSEWLGEYSRQLMEVAPRVLTRIIYDALGGDVTARVWDKNKLMYTNKILGFNDEKGTSVVDVSGGFTMAKFYEILERAAMYGLGNSPLILILPYNILNKLHLSLLSNQHCCVSLGDMSQGFTTTTTYGNIVVLHPYDIGSAFTWHEGADNTKARGYAFFKNSVELAYCPTSTVSMGAPSETFIPLKPSVSNGFLNGKIDINPNGRAGGVDSFAKINAGAMRINPKGIVAIDFKASDLLKG